ncbi:MAG: ribosome maturation factor RimM [Anaerolineaceae bacterium]
MSKKQNPETTPDRDVNGAGSPDVGEPVFLVVGKLRRSHGVQGEITMEVLTDFPERLRPRKVIYLGDEHRPLKIDSARWQDRLLLLHFEGYSDCDNVSELTNQFVYVRADDLPKLPDGRYYHHQLVGLQVVTETGEILGRLKEILVTGANDVYVIVSDSGSETLLPAIESVILGVDLDQKVMTVRPQIWS